MKSWDLNRRSFLSASGVLVGTVAAPALVRSPASAATNVINVWTYADYLPQDFLDQFQKDTGIEVRIRLFDDQGAQFNLLAAEAPNPSTDVVTVASHRFNQFIESDLLAPIDTDRLRKWNVVNPVFSESEWISVKGKKWGVPILAGADALCYNTEFVSPEEANTWMIMFNDKFKGKVSYDLQGFFVALMTSLGYDGNLAKYVGDPAKAQEAVNAARDMMIKHKDMVPKYITSGPETQQMFINQEIVAALYGSGPFSKLIMEGLPLDMTIPKEGGYAYVFNFNIVNNAANTDNAYKLLEAVLSNPEVGAAMVRASGYTSTLVGVDKSLTDLERKAVSFSQEELERLIFMSAANDQKWPLIDKAAEQVKAA